MSIWPCSTVVRLKQGFRSKVFWLVEARMKTDFANIEGIFNTNTGIVKKAIDGILPEQWFLRPGNDSNHLMWVAGHLVVHRGAVLKTLGAGWETSWSSLFTRCEAGSSGPIPSSRGNPKRLGRSFRETPRFFHRSNRRLAGQACAEGLTFFRWQD
jgi:uncharacterized protein YfaT (DUF1175 family)